MLRFSPAIPAALLTTAALAIAAPAPAAAAEWRFAFQGASAEILANPHDLKLSPDGRHLFVGDVGNDRVAILDADTLDLVATFGEGEQAGSRDVDFDAEGRAYVADTYNHRVAIYAMEGTSARLVGELSERLRGPEGVLVHPNGRVYVAGAWSNNLVAFQDGEVVAELGGLSRPHDVERAPDGRLWLADSGNRRLLLLSEELEVLRELSGATYDFKGPRYQDVLDDGTLIAGDKTAHRIKVIGPDGALLAVLGTGEPGKGPNRFRTPEGVEVRGDTLWISDSGNDRVVEYRMTRGD